MPNLEEVADARYPQCVVGPRGGWGARCGGELDGGPESSPALATAPRWTRLPLRQATRSTRGGAPGTTRVGERAAAVVLVHEEERAKGGIAEEERRGERDGECTRSRGRIQMDGPAGRAGARTAPSPRGGDGEGRQARSGSLMQVV
ncbi:hypothetical protein PR202_gb13845 [Eleusine coracana subsp. coracana]|uniref:Uncharacterized protein n=1 Tax=Eleusine coracana subsp. coracana TaxID=191504 RepID=A0AAV5ETH3_ELECO|nr:hypothetical protein PR202_gb13845 [Eleusine coracana subsp. coracana]